MSVESRFIIMGGGGHAAVVADAAIRAGLRIHGFLDDHAEARLFDVPHLGPIAEDGTDPKWMDSPFTFHVAIGGNATRSRLHALAAKWRGAEAASVIHPSAIIAESASIARGAFVGPLAVVNARARIGVGAIINSGAIIEHDVQIGDFAHVAPGAAIAGGAAIGERSFVGLNVSLLPGIRIGADAVVGAGGVVTTDVAAGVTVAGVPARPLSVRPLA